MLREGRGGVIYSKKVEFLSFDNFAMYCPLQFQSFKFKTVNRTQKSVSWVNKTII